MQTNERKIKKVKKPYFTIVESLLRTAGKGVNQVVTRFTPFFTPNNEAPHDAI